MAIFPFVSQTRTIGATEYSIAKDANYSSGSPMTTRAYVTVFVDFFAAVAGDVFEIKLYETVGGGTQRLVETWRSSGVPSSLYRADLGIVGEGWDVTVQKISGTDRSIGFGVHMDVNDVNAFTIANAAIAAATFAAGAITNTVIAAAAIGASQIASLAITAAKFATDAIDSNALAASAVAEIQTGLPLATDYTSTRAAKLDNLDATISSRAAAATALSTATWTNTRAAELDNLTLSLTTVNNNVSAVGTAVIAVNADTDDIQSRLPSALDGGGNIKAGVQSLVGSTISSVADAVMNYVVEAAPANATTFLQRQRVVWSIFGGLANLLGVTIAGTEQFRSADGTKVRASFTLATDGTRTPGSFDGT